MAYNAILVQLDLDAAVAPTLKFGLGLGRRLETDVIVFAAAEAHVFVPGDEGGIVAIEMLKQQTEEIEHRLEAMKEEFLAVVGDDEHVSWRGIVGDPTRQLALHGRAADLIVLGTTGPASRRDVHRSVDRGSLVLSAGRPVFVPAADLSPVQAERIVVAWKDTREARRAVSDAMPFLKATKEVVVVTIEEADQRQARESASDVVRFLSRHGTVARADVLGVGNANVEDAISRIAQEIGADLVVAGAYGHSRLREWAFGGVTRSLLADGSIHRLISN